MLCLLNPVELNQVLNSSTFELHNACVKLTLERHAQLMAHCWLFGHERIDQNKDHIPFSSFFFIILSMNMHHTIPKN